MHITKAIVPVAGLGTRLLPTTKALPKEMLPVGRFPVIHYVVEELVSAGIRQILFVTSGNKGAIAEHFDENSELIRLFNELFFCLEWSILLKVILEKLIRINL